MNEFWKKQETIFDICIKQLKPDLKKYYEDLAIFCEDVNIASKVCNIIKVIKFIIIDAYKLSHIFFLFYIGLIIVDSRNFLEKRSIGS